MRRGTQGHVAAPRGPTRHLQGDVTLFIFIYMGVIVHIVFRLSEEIINYLNTSHVINPMLSLNFLRVGLSSTELFFMQVTWPLAVRRIDKCIGNLRFDCVDVRTTGSNESTCWKSKSYNICDLIRRYAS